MSERGDLTTGVQVLICVMVAAPIYFAVTYWYIILIVLAVAAIVVLIGWTIFELDEWTTRRGQKKAAIIERAESQHARLMDGDQTALYGLYPPADLQ